MKEEPSIVKPLMKDLTNCRSSNKLAKRLYKNNSLTRLNNSMSAGVLNSSMSRCDSSSILGKHSTNILVPSVSLKRMSSFENSQPSIEISKGKVYLKRIEDSLLTKNSNLRKKYKKLDKIDTVDEKSFIPEELKPDYSISNQNKGEEKRMLKKSSQKNFFKDKAKNKSIQDENLTPEDFFDLLEEENISNEFCYLKKMSHPYDLKIIEFDRNCEKRTVIEEYKGRSNCKSITIYPEEYITISSRGVTYFNVDGSRFVPLKEWKKEAFQFRKLMQMEFFGKYKLLKDFSNWKKYTRKISMKKTMDKLKDELLLNDRYLRNALLTTKQLCFSLQNQTSYIRFDDSMKVQPFSKFKMMQDTYIQDKFETRILEIQGDIRRNLIDNLGTSMKDFKEDKKITTANDNKGLPLLIGDEKNLDMPYTKQATLRTQQDKFKRFLKLVETIMVHSKVNMINESTHNTIRRIEEENENYQDYMLMLKSQNKKPENHHFKGKQFVQCFLHINPNAESMILKPAREDINNLFEDIINKCIIKLVRNHKKIIMDEEIMEIIYQGSEIPPKECEGNSLKSILTSDEMQENVVADLTRSINRSYDFVELYSESVAHLVHKYYENQQQLQLIPTFTSEDYFNIKEMIQKWKKQLQDISKLNEQYESSIFMLNFKLFKEVTTQCITQCMAKIKEIVPAILESTVRKLEKELREAIGQMETIPIGIEVFIKFQINKARIVDSFDYYQEKMMEVGQIIDILKDMNINGENIILKYNKEKKQLSQNLKTLKSKVEQSQMHSKAHENYAIDEIKKMIPRINQNIHHLLYSSKREEETTQDNVQKINNIGYQFAKIQEQIQKIKDYQKFLVMENYNSESAVKFEWYFQNLKQIWNFKVDYEEYEHQLYNTSWSKVDILQIQRKIEDLVEKNEKIRKNISRQAANLTQIDEFQIQQSDQKVISSVLSDIRKKLIPLASIIECLKDKSLEEKEFRIIRNEFERRNKDRLNDLIIEQENKDIRDKDVKVSLLIEERIYEEQDFLEKVVFKSKKQSELNSKISTVSKFWSSDNLNNNSKELLDNFAINYYGILAEIDERITVINCVKEDPEADESDLKLKIESERIMFDNLRTLLVEWELHHSYLSYFEPIFNNSYWKGTNQFKNYTAAENNWKKLLKQISKDFSLRKLATQEKKHISVFKENNSCFHQLKKTIEYFLNSKREACPKLFFLSEQDLLSILLQDKDFSSIEKHLPKIFPHLKALEYNNEERLLPTGVINLNNESLKFRSFPNKTSIEVEEGLRLIDDRIKESLRSGIIKCTNYYLQDEFSRREWVRDNITQVLLFVGNTQFVKLLQCDYLEPSCEDLPHLLVYQNSIIKQLYGFLKDLEHPSEALKIDLLIMQALHFLQIIQKVISHKIDSEKSFDWQKEVRSYNNGSDSVITKYLSKSIDYGFQFICPNYGLGMCSISEREFVQLANTLELGYLPVIQGSSTLVESFCNFNAKNFVVVNGSEKLASNYLYNLCQGTYYTGTFLEIRNGNLLTEENLSTICSVLKEVRTVSENRHNNFMFANKNYPLNPSSSIVFRLGALPKGVRPLQDKIRLKYRVLSIPQIPIATALAFLMSYKMMQAGQFAQRVQKAIEAVNKCSGFPLFCLQDVMSIAQKHLQCAEEQFVVNFYQQLNSEIQKRVVGDSHINLYLKIVKEIVIREKSHNSLEKSNKENDIVSHISKVIEVLDKKSLCVLVGPYNSGKDLIIGEAAYKCGIENLDCFNSDHLSFQSLMGTYEKGLWKEGILIRKLKSLRFMEEHWLKLEGSTTAQNLALLSSVIQGEISLENGETVFLSPKWKFLFTYNQIDSSSCVIPKQADILCEEKFLSNDQKLSYLLDLKIRIFFKMNLDSYNILKNLCINNFIKILKFRISGFVFENQLIISSFIDILESVLAKTPDKILEDKENQKGLEKLFTWSLYWSINSALSLDKSEKFDSLFYEQIKTDIERGMSLRQTKFEFDCLQGSLKKIEVLSHLQIEGDICFSSSVREAKTRLIEKLVGCNKNVFLNGSSNSGKSLYLTALKHSLGYQSYSFLQIRLSRDMPLQTLFRMIYKKLKISIISSGNSFKKYLTSINGKKLVFMIDDFNLLRQGSELSCFLHSCIMRGFYYESHTNEKIQLNNVCFVVAENSSHELAFTNDLLRHFKTVSLDDVPYKEVCEIYEEDISNEHISQICHSTVALHEFAKNEISKYEEMNPKVLCIDIPLRVIKTMKNYTGNENLIKVWEYLVLKEYTTLSMDQRVKEKVSKEISNYMNLMMKNNAYQIEAVPNQQLVGGNITSKLAGLSLLEADIDYYFYLAFVLKLSEPHNVYTIRENICPSTKKEVIGSLCHFLKVQMIYPFRAYELNYKKNNCDTVIYLSDQDPYFKEIADYLNDITHLHENQNLLIDFSDEQSWQCFCDDYPSMSKNGKAFFKDWKVDVQLDASCHNEFKLILQKMQEQKVPMHHYDQMEVKLLILREQRKLASSIEQKHNRTNNFLESYDQFQNSLIHLQQTNQNFKKQISQLCELEEEQRKQLLVLKNNYNENNENEAEDEVTNAHNINAEAIHQIEMKLNELMIQKQNKEKEMKASLIKEGKIKKVLEQLKPLQLNYQQKLKTQKIHVEFQHEIIVFLMFLKYYLTKNESLPLKVLGLLSLSLPSSFQQITNNIFGAKVPFDEREVMLWLLNDKSIILEDVSGSFASRVLKYFPSVRIVHTPTQLSCLNFSNQTTIVCGEIVQSEPTSDSFIRKIVSRRIDKQRKDIIEFVKENSQYRKSREEPREGKDKEISNELQNDISARKSKRISTQKNDFLGLSLFKKQNIEFREDFTMKNQSIYKIKVENEEKESVQFAKTVAEKQYMDFLKVFVSDEEYHQGKNVIEKAVDKDNNEANSVSLVSTRHYRPVLETREKLLAAVSCQDKEIRSSLLSSLEPHIVHTLNNYQSQLQKLSDKHAHQENQIVEKMTQGTQQSIEYIFNSLLNFYETIMSRQEQVSHNILSTNQQISQKYGSFLQEAQMYWEFLNKVTTFYPTYNWTCPNFIELLRDSITFEVIQEELENSEEKKQTITDHIDFVKSRAKIIKKIINSLVYCLKYQESLLSICLLALSLNLFEGKVHKQLIKKFESIVFKKEMQNHYIALQSQQTIDKILYSIEKQSNQAYYYCKRFIKESLELNFEELYSQKSQWINIPQNLVVISEKDTDSLEMIASCSANTAFIKEKSDFMKCFDSIVERNITKIILINFSKEESFSKLGNYQEQTLNERQVHYVFLFTSQQNLDACRFQKEIAHLTVIKVEERAFLQTHLQKELKKSIEHLGNSEICKIVKMNLFYEMQEYFKLKSTIFQDHQRLPTNCFFKTHFLRNLLGAFELHDVRELICILSDTIYKGQEKKLCKDLKRVLRKQDFEWASRHLHSGDTSEEVNLELSGFLSMSPEEILKTLLNEGLTQFSKIILPLEERKQLSLDFFENSFSFTQRTYQDERPKGFAKLCENMYFESFKNYECLRSLKDQRPHKMLLNSEAKSLFLVYKSYQKKISNILSNSRQNRKQSPQTESFIEGLNEKWEGGEYNVVDYIGFLEKKIVSMEKLYTDKSKVKDINIKYLSNIEQFVHLYIYSGNYKAELFCLNLSCRYIPERDKDSILNSIEDIRGFFFQNSELHNCKFDQGKNVLELNEKNDNKNLPFLVVSLFQKDLSLANPVTLPILYQGQPIFEIELNTKVKEDFKKAWVQLKLKDE